MTDIEQLNHTLNLFKLDAQCTNFHQFKRAYSFDIELGPKGRIKHLERVLNEISIMLKMSVKPTLTMLAEQGILKLEYVLPLNQRIDLFDLGRQSQRPNGQLPCLLGETIRGEQMWFDLATAPHMLVAGTTGSGKSTLLHAIIANLLMYDNVVINIIDPKGIEFISYQSYSKVKVSTDYQQAMNTLHELYDEMGERYNYMREGGQLTTSFPYHVLIIDEFADLIMQDEKDEFQTLICKLAQKSRSAGIHLILATQRPASSILNGNIKANFPTRLACKVASSIDSRIILDQMGAEKLNGHGDAILKSCNDNIIRFQGAYCDSTMISKYLHD